MKLSKMHLKTLREVPNEAEIPSHILMLRSGMIRKLASGVYGFMPLGWRTLRKIEGIIREEMDAAGGQEIHMSAIQPSELWEESGRWYAYGPELWRIKDRHGREFCLGPTHEEIFTDIVRTDINSYRQLPMNLYQIQTKYRDEARPRFGLMRSREFIMKDAYSFHATQESLQETYDDMSRAYGTICDRCGLDYRPVEADGGQIGGKVTTEFMALAPAGEAELVHCTCGYAANTEAGECLARPTECEATELKKIHTPGVRTIEELAEFLGIPESSTVKALSGKDAEGKLVVMFVPGDHELNEIKAERAVPGFALLTDEEMESFGLHKGSMGPVGLPEGARIIAARSLKGIAHWVVGANEDDYHYVGAEEGRDFTVDEWADLCVVKPGDCCPDCGLPLSGSRGIEVSQVFQLGTRYSETMGATFHDEDGVEHPFIMGCYGVGVSRTVAAIVEQHNDENGIQWPFNVAPAHVCIIPLTVGDDEVQPAAEKLASEIADFGFDVVIDDRKERAGVKFADADLIGWPLQVVIGKRGLAEGNVEVKLRRTGQKKDVSLSTIAELLRFAKRNARKHPSGLGAFAGIFE